MASPSITLYLDIVSPFSYIAYYVLRHSAIFSTCKINYVPISLGGLFKLCSNTPPIAVKSYKYAWINRERLSWANRFRVPMAKQVPEGFPQNTLPLQQVLCAISRDAPDSLAPAIDALYDSLWAKGNGRTVELDSFLPILTAILGEVDAKAMLDLSEDAGIKNLLQSNTQKLFESGGFGLPWFECTGSDGEVNCFWGVDRIWQVVEFLGLVENREELAQFIPGVTISP
ncbi:hypothetical protein ARAM_000115 [Aspergillus rambellii]|uniref:Glutathione S-transferase kappa n=1 Tax=Aspergillus rambellii TaxID=308745 RepID=A0A0F8UZE6_9EURO|nr:hypothetical protein ARAM_000115 [Aspergillus rambellii]